MEHAVIMAGGSGTRLWPMSRRARPKQLLPLIDGRDLMSLALERLKGCFAPERTWVITNAELADAIRRAAPHLPPENVLGEPAIRDTSNAIGLACLLIGRRDPDARVGIFTADHVIRPADRFAAAVGDGLSLLDDYPEALVTLGVVPAHPHTGLGYIRRGEPIRGRIYRVERFVEKPDRATARGYLAEGCYYWNSGMFIWRTDAVMRGLARFRPEHAAMLQRAASAWSDGDMGAAADLYGDLPRISIDYALMEPASADPDCTVLVRELDCEWMDVGSWGVLGDLNPADASDNLLIGRVAALDASGNVLISDDPEHLLAAIGIEDMVVVHSGGATLVAPKARAQDVKTLLERIRAEHGERYE